MRRIRARVDAAHAVDGPGEALGSEDPARVDVEVIPADDVGGPQADEPGALVGLAGAGHHLVAPAGQEGHGEGADPARRPGDEDGAVAGTSPWASRRSTDRAAVNPAVPMIMAWRADRPAGRARAKPAGSRA